jgi:2-isopropylmalate synthase
VRVLIESTDGDEFWRTVGSSTDIIEASWLALADSLEWWLTRREPCNNSSAGSKPRKA